MTGVGEHTAFPLTSPRGCWIDNESLITRKLQESCRDHKLLQTQRRMQSPNQWSGIQCGVRAVGPDTFRLELPDIWAQKDARRSGRHCPKVLHPAGYMLVGSCSLRFPHIVVRI